MNQTSLYRFYDADDRLLYVGITVHLPKRLDRHRGQKPWWAEVAHIDVEQHPTRTVALDAEREAIRAERPLYNIQHAEIPVVRRGETLAWFCAACHQPVLDGDGYLGVPIPEVCEREEAFRAWEANHRRPENPLGLVDIGGLLALPELVAWRSWHYDCHDPAPYAISVDRIRTPWDVLDWTAHLMEKAWLESTNWGDLLRSLHTTSGRRAA